MQTLGGKRPFSQLGNVIDVWLTCDWRVVDDDNLKQCHQISNNLSMCFYKHKGLILRTNYWRDQQTPHLSGLQTRMAHSSRKTPDGANPEAVGSIQGAEQGTGSLWHVRRWARWPPSLFYSNSRNSSYKPFWESQCKDGLCMLCIWTCF